MKDKFIVLTHEMIRDTSMTMQEKIVFLEVQSLSSLDNGCIASNSHFEKSFGISKKSVSNTISSLVKKGLVVSEITNRNHKRVLSTKDGLLSIKDGQVSTKDGLLSIKDGESKGTISINKTINKTISPQGGNVSCSKTKKKSVDDRRKDFYNKVSKHLGEYKKETLRDFYDHWSTLGDNDKKMSFEKERTWNTSKRLVTWAKNNYNGTENNVATAVKPSQKGTGVFS